MKNSDNLNYLVFEDKDWALKSAILLAEKIKTCCLNKGECNFMLTGGQSASHIYVELFPLISTLSNNIKFYFGDERCVSKSSPDSNFNMVMQALQENFDKYEFFRIRGDANNLIEECDRYANLLPKHIDILLLSIGDDAHIASIFPNFDLAINEKNIVITSSPCHKYDRITITKKIIDTSNQIFCLVKGSKKGHAMTNTFKSDSNSNQFPAKLVSSATWLLDRSAKNNFEYNKV
jgi:6-phosphogluconolactonase